MQKISRRKALATGVMATAAGLLGRTDRLFAKAAQPRTKVNFAVPPGACDTHVHVFGDPAQYPFIPNRVYTPEQASIAELRAMLDALHMERVLVVHPSVYGTDNRCSVDAVRQLGNRARGIAVIDGNTPAAELDSMARAGIRGIRLNLTQAGVSDPAAAGKVLQAAMERAKARDWHLQINTNLRIIDALKDQLGAAPIPIVIDHFGGATGAGGVEQPGFSTLVALVKSGKTYVKISAAADFVSTKAPDYPDVVPLAKALVAANPQRILWGTDWPHPDSRVLPERKNTDIAPLIQTDDGLVLNQLPVWVPDAAVRKMILVDNPARLYGF
ncbi:MAG: amidohydrolase family protein [Vicinamibacterales bacterium]|nr:amidohydrolase family protein [Vicinamibacterales bacterium]